MSTEQGTFNSSGRKGGKRPRYIEYAVSLAIAAVAVVFILNTAGERAAQDWTMVKTNLDPDWVPPADKPLMTKGQIEGTARYAANTTHGR